MRIALCSDEPYPVHQTIQNHLRSLGHEIIPFGAIKTGEDSPWGPVAIEAAEAVVSGVADEGIFLCWTGTGISIAANKVPGIRAGLCGDPGTARGARVWNHANVLCLSNRTLSDDMAKEILTAWFEPFDSDQGADGVAWLTGWEL